MYQHKHAHTCTCTWDQVGRTAPLAHSAFTIIEMLGLVSTRAMFATTILPHADAFLPT